MAGAVVMQMTEFEVTNTNAGTYYVLQEFEGANEIRFFEGVKADLGIEGWLDYR